MAQRPEVVEHRGQTYEVWHDCPRCWRGQLVPAVLEQGVWEWRVEIPAKRCVQCGHYEYI